MTVVISLYIVLACPTIRALEAMHADASWIVCAEDKQTPVQVKRIDRQRQRNKYHERHKQGGLGER